MAAIAEKYEIEAPVVGVTIEKGLEIRQRTDHAGSLGNRSVEEHALHAGLRILCSINSTTNAAWWPFTAIRKPPSWPTWACMRCSIAGRRARASARIGGGKIHSHKSMGHVADIFTKPVLATLPGELAIGHTRYSTAGDTVLLNAQPFSVVCNKGQSRGGAQRQHHQRRRTARRTRTATARFSRHRATPR